MSPIELVAGVRGGSGGAETTEECGDLCHGEQGTERVLPGRVAHVDGTWRSPEPSLTPLARPLRRAGHGRRLAYAPAVTTRVDIADSCTDELIEAFERLTPQLSSSAPPPGPDELTEIIESPATHLLVARDPERRIVGSLTLVLFRIPTGMRAWIEDVVVDDEARGQGVGEALNLFAIDLAAQHGARSVDLTSRPSREAANRLYQRLGFVARETNVYRYQG